MKKRDDIFSLSKKGFTLIELLLVISIITLLSTVVVGSLNVSRVKARDTQRKATLQTYRTAFELYYNEHGTYRVLGAGEGGAGVGSLKDGSPTITEVLYNEGFLSAVIQPVTGSSDDYYLIKLCESDNVFALFAKLENVSDDAYYDPSSIQDVCTGSETPLVYPFPNYAITNKLY